MPSISATRPARWRDQSAREHRLPLASCGAAGGANAPRPGLSSPPSPQTYRFLRQHPQLVPWTVLVTTPHDWLNHGPTEALLDFQGPNHLAASLPSKSELPLAGAASRHLFSALVTFSRLPAPASFRSAQPAIESRRAKRSLSA